jgi:putative SOS response-associated peptidase YedK
LALLRPYPADDMQLWPVSTCVGKVQNNGPDLTMPIEIDDESMF